MKYFNKKNVEKFVHYLSFFLFYFYLCKFTLLQSLGLTLSMYWIWNCITVLVVANMFKPHYIKLMPHWNAILAHEGLFHEEEIVSIRSFLNSKDKLKTDPVKEIYIQVLAHNQFYFFTKKIFKSKLDFHVVISDEIMFPSISNGIDNYETILFIRPSQLGYELGVRNRIVCKDLYSNSDIKGGSALAIIPYSFFEYYNTQKISHYEEYKKVRDDFGLTLRENGTVYERLPSDYVHQFYTLTIDKI